MMTRTPPEWMIGRSPVPYADALRLMERRVDEVIAGRARELVWLLEHPPTITAGTSAAPGGLLNAQGIPVFSVGRGGQYTWHGPGQRVAYLVLDLNRRKRDVRRFVQSLETWVSQALFSLGVEASPREGRVGLWVDRRDDKGPGHEDKIAAIGIRLRRWVCFHGVSVNVNPDLGEFERIVPCGIDDPKFGVTSLSDLGLDVSIGDVDRVLKRAFAQTPDLLPRPASC